ncbi:hypothetical protein [Nocardia cyriacigeorgica]|uniref:hypothetical protein n=1 Tax=Nocardia cyriacigeorgica TaxID=135487 RepID=UPI002457C89B|nr:hypothetical protein [Nocardia cyriacigeorgica]
MIKSTFFTAVLTAATGSLLFIPAAPAHAVSPQCTTAIEWINTAIDTSGGAMDAPTATALSDRLNGLALVAQGEEKTVISAYANALVDDTVTDLDPYTTELNRVCGLP